MNLFDSFEPKKFVTKSTYQILCMPNITSQRALTKDSYVLVMENVIKELNKIRDDLFFHMPLTSFCPSLDFPNVKQYMMKTPSYPNSMRAHYDYYFWDELLDARKMEIDIIWSHLPEQTTNIVNHCHNVSAQRVPIIGYSHWIENKEFAPDWERTFYHNNITGMLQMRQCGLNTQTQIDALLEEAKEYYSEQTIKKLTKIMTPLYLGVETDRILSGIVESTPPVIVFNHRTQKYREWALFLEILQELRSTRKDFTVWCSMADATARGQIKVMFPDDDFFDFVGPADRNEYINKLRSCRFGFHGGTRWAMSSQDGLCKGIPYVFRKGAETHELFGDKLETGWENKKEAVALFNKMLDDQDFRNRQAQFALEHCSTVHAWTARVIPFNNMINDALDELRADIIQGGGKKDDIADFIRNNFPVTTEELRNYLQWGRQMPFKRYRNYLRTLPGIHTTMIDDKENYIFNKEQAEEETKIVNDLPW